MARPSFSFFRIIKVITTIVSGLSLAIEDGEITIIELANILQSVCKILDIPVHFNVPENIRKITAAVSELPVQNHVNIPPKS